MNLFLSLGALALILLCLPLLALVGSFGPEDTLADGDTLGIPEEDD